jgi:multimeric flavodoxin WrbA
LTVGRKSGRVDAVNCIKSLGIRIFLELTMLLGISASKRKWGNCETAVKSALLAAMKRGAKTAFIRLTDIPLEPCRGCFRCLAGGGACPTEDGLYDLLCHIRSVESLVLAAPVYFMAPPAKLFSLLDRLLSVSGFKPQGGGPKRAATVTIMGNRRWRGVAEPYVNLVASLLGFEVEESLPVVAEGPGEVLLDTAAIERIEAIGTAFAEGTQLSPAGERANVCPVCRSDFFVVESKELVCPVCGLKGDLASYAKDGGFKPTGGEARWGTGWLRAHVEAWVKPSVERFKAERRTTLSKLSEFRSRYASEEERGA